MNSLQLQLETRKGLIGPMFESYEVADLYADKYYTLTMCCPTFYNHISGFSYTPAKYRHLLR